MIRGFIVTICLSLIACGILEPGAQIGDFKRVTFAEDGFTCQASAATYAKNGWAAHKDEWHFMFIAEVVNDSSNAQCDVVVEFVVLEKSTEDKIEFASVCLGHLWKSGEKREGSIISDSSFSTKEMYEMEWSARLVIL